MSERNEADVLTVGVGPVGLTLTIDPVLVSDPGLSQQREREATGAALP